MLISDVRLKFDIRGVSLRNFLQACAISAGAALLILTVVPAAARPYTGIQHDLEHFSAFLLLGFLLGIAFRTKIPLLLLTGTLFTLAMECIQIPLPTRHARFEDFGFDTAAVCVGILIARLPWRRVNSWWNRSQEGRTRNS
jgi:VanZ family protein